MLILGLDWSMKSLKRICNMQATNASVQVCYSDDETPTSPINRILIGNISRGNSCSIKITSDSDKFYCQITFGMMHEGILEVGYSSVNGGLWEAIPDTIKVILEAAQFNWDNLAEKPDTKVKWLHYLSDLTEVLDLTWNKWLGENQQLIMENLPVIQLEN